MNQYASDPKRENLANEIIKLKTENQKLKSENEKLDHENINYRIRIDKMVKSDERTQSNFYETLKENEKLENLIKHLKTEMRVARSFLDYENNDDLR